MKKPKNTVFIGTYTEGRQYFPCDGVVPSRGIYRVLYDSEIGSFGPASLAAELANPSWLTWHPSGSLLYAVTEAPVEGFRGGAVNVLRRNPITDTLDFLARFDSFGLAPCHLAVEPNGRFLIVSNYRGDERGGNFVLFPLDFEGLPDSEPLVFQASGKGPNPHRQESPHAHSVCFDPVNETLCMIDLGVDTIFVRKYDSEKRMFYQPQNTRDLQVPVGSGCRHAVFSPDGNRFFVVGELNCMVSVFVRNESGNLEGPARTVSTLPKEFVSQAGSHSASAICIHPAGKTLYVSNRGHGSVSVFELFSDENRLELVQNIAVDGKMPRFCCLDTEGKHLIVCGQDTATVQTFRLDSETGKILAACSSLPVDSPVCIL